MKFGMGYVHGVREMVDLGSDESMFHVVLSRAGNSHVFDSSICGFLNPVVSDVNLWGGPGFVS